MTITRVASLLLSVIVGTAHLAYSQAAETGKRKAKDPANTCIEVLRSNCSVSQQTMLNKLLENLNIHGISKKDYPGNPPAFDALPKDKSGQVNWVKAFNQGLINPRGSVHGKEKEEPHENFYNDLIFMQVKVHIMADVVFPHGMHSYWLSCDSCHPKPFKDEIGSNKIKMSEIVSGKWCGKCHGKVAFSPKQYSNCRRCHVLPKRTWGTK